MRIICSANILQIIDKIPSRPSWLVWDCAMICWLRLYLALTFTPGQDPSSAALAVLAGNNGPSFSLPCPATEISQQATMITCGGSVTPLWHLRGPHYDSVVPLPPPRQSLYRPSVTIQSISVRSLPFISDKFNKFSFHWAKLPSSGGTATKHSEQTILLSSPNCFQQSTPRMLFQVCSFVSLKVLKFKKFDPAM